MRKRNPPGQGRNPNCGKCGKIKERIGQAWCNGCISEWSRKNRKKHSELPDRQRIKANARAYVKEYIKRGIVKKLPCSICGSSENLEAHHEDYSKPLEVIWYCRKHHLQLHEKLKYA